MRDASSVTLTLGTPTQTALPSPALASNPRPRAATTTVCLTVTSGGVVETVSRTAPTGTSLPSRRHSHSTSCGSLGELGACVESGRPRYSAGR